MNSEPRTEPRWADRVVELRRERRDKILELRGEGMTQREIADALGVSVGTVNGDLTGESTDESTAAQAALSAAVQSTVRPAAERTPVERLQSGSLPESVAPADDINPGAIADRILRRPW